MRPVFRLAEMLKNIKLTASNNLHNGCAKSFFCVTFNLLNVERNSNSKMLNFNKIAERRDDLIHSFFDAFKRSPSSDYPINLMQNKQSLGLFLNEVMPFGLASGLTSNFIEAVNQFSLSYETYLQRYFAGKELLQQICRVYSSFVFRKQYSISENMIIKSFKYMYDFTNEIVTQIVSNFGFKKEVNILAYGGADGASERHIISMLYRQGCEKVRLYLYDPYNSVKSSEHIYLSRKICWSIQS